ncbi:hypothetical protein F5X99DRAFT_62375 [Biscogniauxia marginata]|nr:hypothetical protein F5X99DRAFT_62375 [Biscogniauxia marginata]
MSNQATTMASKPETGMRSCIAKQLQRVLSTQKRCIEWCDLRKGAVEGRRLARPLARPGHIIKVIRRSLVLHPADLDEDLSAKYRAIGATVNPYGQDSMFRSFESFEDLGTIEKSLEAGLSEPSEPVPRERERLDPWKEAVDLEKLRDEVEKVSESGTICASEPRHVVTSKSSSSRSFRGFATGHHLTSSSIYLRKTEIIFIPPPKSKRLYGRPRRVFRKGFRRRLREYCKGLFTRIFSAPSPFLLATMA